MHAIQVYNCVCT